ncbi:hypothetical protein POM88_037375 [Heracleum sosnowskyi]|uniref:Uncharacterized protein n=1 Tax=Heracleum sosnowskyi TaxID=360622 RepID=A0AAD8MGK0_9APIA|nr:hypothetical protein POM88_037375 [Heracleum sosnowskyi]
MSITIVGLVAYLATIAHNVFVISCRGYAALETREIMALYVDLPLRYDNGIWEQGTEVWVGVKPPIDVDVFGRSDSDEAESKMHVMDLFLWERWLTEDEIAVLPSSIGSVDYNMIDLPQDIWKWADSPSRVDEWDSDPTDDTNGGSVMAINAHLAADRELGQSELKC